MVGRLLEQVQVLEARIAELEGPQKAAAEILPGDLDFSMIQPEEKPARRVPRISFSDEFISNLRTRWDERRGTPSTPGRERTTPSEPIYDEIYEEALGLMDEDEGMTPRPSRKHRLEGPGQERSG